MKYYMKVLHRCRETFIFAFYASEKMASENMIWSSIRKTINKEVYIFYRFILNKPPIRPRDDDDDDDDDES